MTGEAKVPPPESGAGEFPRVSVIVPCWNAAAFLGEALESVADQTEVATEVLVVSDGSPDVAALRAVVERFPGVRLLEEPHRGVSGARNAGLAAATAGVVAFLDADDCWLRGFLADQLRLLERSGADLVWCDARYFGDAGRAGRSVMEITPSRGPPTLEALRAGDCTPILSTVVARAECVRAAGGFDGTLDRAEDFDLWIRMLEVGRRFAYRPEVGALRRLHAANVSNDNAALARALADVIRRSLARTDPGAPTPRAVRRRFVVLDREIHVGALRCALAEKDSRATRRALWAIVRSGGSPKHLLSAVGYTLAPPLVGPLLHRRMWGRSRR